MQLRASSWRRPRSHPLMQVCTCTARVCYSFYWVGSIDCGSLMCRSRLHSDLALKHIQAPDHGVEIVVLFDVLETALAAVLHDMREPLQHMHATAQCLAAMA